MRTDWSEPTEEIFQGALRLLDLINDPDGKSRITTERAAMCLDALGPIISLLLATQSEDQIRLWIIAVVSMQQDKDDFLTKVTTQ